MSMHWVPYIYTKNLQKFTKDDEVKELAHQHTSQHTQLHRTNQTHKQRVDLFGMR